MARMRSTGTPSSPAWWIVICPVDSLRPQRITSVPTVKGPGCEAVMKYAESTTGSTCSVVSVGSARRCPPRARRAVAMTRPPLTALPIIHSSWKAPCHVVGSSPGSSRVASSYSLTGQGVTDAPEPVCRGVASATVGVLCDGVRMDTTALLVGLVVGGLFGAVVAWL